MMVSMYFNPRFPRDRDGLSIEYSDRDYTDAEYGGCSGCYGQADEVVVDSPPPAPGDEVDVDTPAPVPSPTSGFKAVAGPLALLGGILAVFIIAGR